MSATARDKYPLNLPVSRKETTARLAKDDGVSLNQWIATAVASEDRRGRDGGSVPGANEPRERTPGDLVRYLDGAPHTPPAPGDEMPEA